MRRVQGRVTRDDVRSAGLRRWDGRSRVTTDWVNIFHVSLSIPSSARRPSTFKALTSTPRNPSFAGRPAIASSIYANLANRVEALLSECILLSSESKVSTPWSTVVWSETPSMSIQIVSCRIALAVTLLDHSRSSTSQHRPVLAWKMSSTIILQPAISLHGYIIDPWLGGHLDRLLWT